MSISVGDVLLKAGIDLTDWNSQLGQMKDSVNDSLGNIQSQFTKVGATLVGIGGAIVASITGIAMAGVNEEESMARLAQSVENTGTSFSDVKGQIDSVTTALSEHTNYSKNQSLDALNRLTIQTKDYNTAVSLLPVALDLASAMQIDATTAAQYLSKAIDGDYTALERYFPGIKNCKDAQEALNFIMNATAGSAGNAVSPFTELKNTVENLAASLGNSLVPILKSFVAWITPIIDNIRDWIESHQTLTKVILIVVAAIGGLILVLGTVMLAVVAATVAWVALNVAFVATPIGWVVLALAALIAIFVLVITHIDWIKEHWQLLIEILLGPLGFAIAAVVKYWDDIKTAAVDCINWIIDGINDVINALDKIPGVHIGTIGLLSAGTSTPTQTMDSGGIITDPTLLTNLKTGQPYAIAAANGQPETVNPAGGGLSQGSLSAIAAAIQSGLAGIRVNVGGKDVGAVVSREQYHAQNTKARVLGTT